MKVSRGVRRSLLGHAACLVYAAGLGTLDAAPVKADAKETGKGRPHPVEETFYSDVHPTGSDQQLAAPLEKRAQAQAEFIQGIIAEDDGAFEDALGHYTAALQLDVGSNPALAVRVAREYAKRGDVAIGINLLKDLAKAKPDDLSAQLALSEFYLRELNKPDLALKYAETAARIAPDNLAAYQGLFEVYFALKRKREAEQALKRAELVDNKDPDFWLSLTELALRLYRTDNSAVPTAKVPEVMPFLQRASGLAGNDPRLLTRVADDYIAIGQVSSAIPLYLRALESNRGNAEIRYKLAQSFLRTGQRDAAISALEEMVKTNPLKPEIYEFLARLYQEGNNRERALANYQQALLLEPNDPENYLRAAEVLLQLRKNDEAIATLSDARRRFASPQITYALAIALSQAKRFDEALPTFESALQEADAAGQDPFDAGFYFNYAAAAEQAGFIDKAAALLKKSIEMDPSRAAQAYNFLAYMWVDRNQHLDEAGDLIKKALEQDPHNGAYLDSLGWWYYKRGEYGKALTELLHAVDLLKPEDPVVFEHVGDAYLALGNPSQAITMWQKALALDPQNRGLSAKIDREKFKVSANPGPSAPKANPNP